MRLTLGRAAVLWIEALTELAAIHSWRALVVDVGGRPVEQPGEGNVEALTHWWPQPSRVTGPRQSRP